MIDTKRKLTRFYFYSLFSKIALLSIILVILFTVSLYFNFRNYSLDVVNKSNEKILVQLSSNLIQINKYAVSFAATLYANSNSASLMYPENPDIYETMKAITEIDLMIQGIPFLDSAYIYNGKTQMYYSMGPTRVMREKEKFYDKEIVKIIDTMDTKNNASPVARSVNNSDLVPMPKTDVYTYIIPAFFSGTTKVKNAVIVNMKLDWVYNALASLNDSPAENSTNNIIIMDKSGLVLGHSLKDLFLKNISDREYVKQILSSKTKSSFFVSSDNGIRTIVTYVYIQELQWYMLSITPYDYVAASVNKVKNITLSIFLLLTFLAFFLAFILSKQLYTPVRLLWNKTEQMLGKQQSGKNASEFDIIESCFSTAANRLSVLESFKNRNLYNLKEEVLRNILLNKLNGTGAKEGLKELSFSLGYDSNIILILLKFDHYRQFVENASEADQSLYKFALSNIALEIFERSWKGEAADLGNDQIAVILSINEPALPEDLLVEKLTRHITEIHDLYKSYYNMSFSAFISSTIQGIHQAPILYRNVLSLSNYRMVRGKGCILTEKDIYINHIVKFDINNSSISNLLDSLMLGKIDSAYLSLDSIISALYHCEYNMIMFSLSYLSASIFNTLSIIEKNSVLAFGIDFVSFNNHLSSLETLEEVKEEYTGLMRLVNEKMHQRKDQNSDTLISNVIKHIEANYRHRELCTDILADTFNLTSPYLRKLFRESTSKSISEYITDVRMSKAMELLEHTSNTIDEIIDKIGWENKKYFFTIFRKSFGVTPTEYRLKSKVNASISDN